jgi:4'-phosphopantetheinyl transferase EntD
MSSERPVIAAAETNPAVLSPVIASLFPQAVVAAELRAPGDVTLLDPSERASLANAVETRAGEFAAGRLCARRALAELGRAEPIRAAPDRQPIWPRGVVGSITHTVGFAAAVVARDRDLAAIGLDTEIAGRVKHELWRKVCVAEEVAWLETLESDQQACAATLIFAAKEAFYKCQYPTTAQWLYFADARVTAEWGGASGSLTVIPTRPIALLAPGGLAARASSVRGRFHIHGELISAGVFVSTPERPETLERSSTG